MDNFPLKPLLIIEKAKENVLRTPRRRFSLPPPMNLFFFVMSFLCGRTTLFGSLMPFGGAFFAAAFRGKAGYAYALAALLGMASGGAELKLMGQYIFAMCLYSLIFEKFCMKNSDRLIIRASLYTLSLMLSGIFFMVASTRSGGPVLLYDAIMLAVELAAAFVGTAAFTAAIPTVRQMKLSYSFTSAEEMSLVFLFGAALCGAKDITQIGPINIASVLCILTVLVFSVRLGAAKGAVAGLTMGIVSSLGSGTIDTSCVSYAFSGLAAGMCGFYGAIPGCSAFILANALVTALANGSTEILISIYDIFSACVLYSAIPEKLLSRITGFGARDESERAANDEKLYGEYVFDSAIAALTNLDERLTELDQKRKNGASEELRFLERTARRACNMCGMRRLCWNRDIKKTCDSLHSMLQDYNERGEINESLLPKNCLRPKDLTDAFLQMNELYRSDLIWSGKLSELRIASRGQLKAFCEIVRASKSKLSDCASLDRTLADDIARRLQKAEIECSDIVVIRDSDLDPTVTLTLKNCGGFSLCENGAAEIISQACGKRMLRAGRRDCKSCRVSYVAAPELKMSFAFSGHARGGKKVSGDTALFRVINKSLCAAVLCDGMGSGEKAARESSGAAETLLDLIETGIDGERAMEIVNSVFLPFGEVTYSAADLCLYNSAEGRVKIIKCGGAATFSKSGERVDAMYSKTMPLGATARKDVESFSFSAGCGDMIVMITDGVLESAAEGSVKDGWLISEMEKFRGDDPRRLCDIIVEKAMHKCAGAPKDDITVLAAYIE